MSTLDWLPELNIGPRGRIHMIGIGGASMSGLALILHHMGYRVTGSNREEDARLGQLREEGIPVRIGHDPGNVDGADLAVYTTAVGEDNVELAACREKGIPVLDRPTLLGRLAGRWRS